MNTIYQKITHNKFLQLVDLLGETSDFVIKEPVFECNTDRDDEFLVSNVVNIAEQIKKISHIVDIDADDLKSIFYSNGSDHENVVHKLSLNNDSFEVGSYKLFQGKLVILYSFSSGVWFYNDLDGNAGSATHKYLEDVRWDQVFIERDKIDIEDIY